MKLIHCICKMYLFGMDFHFHRMKAARRTEYKGDFRRHYAVW